MLNTGESYRHLLVCFYHAGQCRISLQPAVFTPELLAFNAIAKPEMKTSWHLGSQDIFSFEKYSPAWPSFPLNGGVDRRLSGEESLVWNTPSDDDPVLRRALTERLFLGIGEREPFGSRGDEGGGEVVVDSVELHFGLADARLNTMMIEYNDEERSGQWSTLLAEWSCGVISLDCRTVPL